MPKYTFTRLSIIEEEFTVTADTEAKALELVRDGGPGVDIVKGEWLDWADGSDYELRDVEDELATWIQEGVNNRYRLTEEDKDHLRNMTWQKDL